MPTKQKGKKGKKGEILLLEQKNIACKSLPSGAEPRRFSNTGKRSLRSIIIITIIVSSSLSPRSKWLQRENLQMGHRSSLFSLFLLLWSSGSWRFLQGVDGLRFVIDREECFSHNIHYEGDTVHFSFVVIKSDAPWHSSDGPGVDLVVKGPGGEQVYDTRDRTSEKSEFIAQMKGLFRFCFFNKSPYHETIDFDIHVGHFAYFDQHAKDEHLNPLLEHIAKLEEALYNIQFEQHWLEAQTDRQAIINQGMSRRAVHKAFFESAALIGASVLQVYLLKRLFERKLTTSRV